MLRKFPLIFRFFNSRKLIFPHGFAKYNYLSNKLLQTNTLHVTKRFLNQNEKSVFLREFIAIHNNTGIKHCWKCNSEIDFRSPRCDNKECGVIQEPLSEDLSYFEVLRVNEDRDFTPTFDINLNRLRSSFLKLQQRFHPDSYGFKDSQEYTYAQQHSASINKAYQVLKDPLSRAQYMLQLNNVSATESESLEDPELLMEILDIREQLEEASNENEVKIIQNENEVRIKKTIEKLSHAFKSNDLSLAKELTVKLQYWYNVRNAAVDWAPGKKIEIQH